MDSLNDDDSPVYHVRSSSRTRSYPRMIDSDDESNSNKTRSGDAKPPSLIGKPKEDLESESEYVYGLTDSDLDLLLTDEILRYHDKSVLDDSDDEFELNDSDYNLLADTNNDKSVESEHERFNREARIERPNPWIAECLKSPIHTAHQPFKSPSIKKPDLNLNRRREEQRAEPLIRAAWEGDFAVHCDREETPAALFGGLKGCVSSKACAQVRVAVERLPASIGWEKLPRWCVWPKSFERWGPTDNDIAVYFFPSLAKDESAYESLVFDLIRDDLAMRTTVMGAELLLFTSVELPPLFTRFQGKLYLWGVFRGNQPQL